MLPIRKLSYDHIRGHPGDSHAAVGNDLIVKSYFPRAQRRDYDTFGKFESHLQDPNLYINSFINSGATSETQVHSLECSKVADREPRENTRWRRKRIIGVAL